MKNEKRYFTRLTIHAICGVLIACAWLQVSGLSVFAQRIQEKELSRVPDSTYGPDGVKVITTSHELFSSTHHTTVSFYDGNNVRRKVQDTEFRDDNNNKVSESTSYYDCKENLFYRTSVSYYASGEKHSVTDQRYKGGDFMNPVSGVDRLYAPDGSEERSRRWNPKEEKWEKWEKAPESTSDEISAPRDTSVCPINNYANQLVGGFNIIREDSTPDNFNTYGLDLSFTHNFVRDNTKNSAISHRVGVTADFNMNFRNLNGVDLTKTSVLGGVTLIPFHGLTTADKVTISLNALAGIAHLKSSVGSVSTSDNSFTWKVGGALDVNLSPHVFIRTFGIYYNPTYFGDTTQNNVQFIFGVGYIFGHTGSSDANAPKGP